MAEDMPGGISPPNPMLTSSSSASSSSSSSSIDSLSSSSASSNESGSERENNGEENVSQDSDENDDDDDEDRVNFSPADLTLGSCIMEDLRLCQQDDPYLFCFLLPFVCSNYLLPAYMINNSDLVYLIGSCIDPRQMRDLRSSILSEDIVLFKEPANAAQIGKAKSSAAAKNASKKNLLSASQGFSSFNFLFYYSKLFLFNN